MTSPRERDPHNLLNALKACGWRIVDEHMDGYVRLVYKDHGTEVMVPLDRTTPGYAGLMAALMNQLDMYCHYGEMATWAKDMEELLSTGRRPGTAGRGRPPFGVAFVDGKVVQDAAEQATLKRIRELRAAGHSLRRVSAILNAEGFRPRRSPSWHPQSLARVLAREPKN